MGSSYCFSERKIKGVTLSLAQNFKLKQTKVKVILEYLPRNQIHFFQEVQTQYIHDHDNQTNPTSSHTN